MVEPLRLNYLCHLCFIIYLLRFEPYRPDQSLRSYIVLNITLNLTQERRADFSLVRIFILSQYTLNIVEHDHLNSVLVYEE